MSLRFTSRAFACILAAAFLVAFAPGVANAQQVRVTITNLTSNQVITPITAATTHTGVPLFQLGQPASVDLEKVAEAGDTSALQTTLASNPRVLDIQSAANALPPGQSVTLTLNASPNFDHLLLTAMLVPTNDGFIALNDVDLSPLFHAPSNGPRKQWMTFTSPGYDAGTEANDELCSHVPGPPTVCTGEGFNPSRAGATNYVYIHKGIKGVGDLSSATYDWKNPVAQIVVELVR
jgi:hypothetical protein